MSRVFKKKSCNLVTFYKKLQLYRLLTRLQLKKNQNL